MKFSALVFPSYVAGNWPIMDDVSHFGVLISIAIEILIPHPDVVILICIMPIQIQLADRVHACSYSMIAVTQ